MTGFRFYIIDDSAEVWGTDDVGVAEIANKLDLSITIDRSTLLAISSTPTSSVPHTSALSSMI